VLNCGSDINAVVQVPESIRHNNTLLYIASISGQLDIIRHFVETGCDINICNVDYDTALEFVNSLLHKEMFVDLSNEVDAAPLHTSAMFGDLELARAIVERGAHLKNANKIGKTPLLLAAKHGKLEVFCYVTEIGADINISDAIGHTALHHAAFLCSVEIINILLYKGMSADLTNANGSTPLYGLFSKEVLL
jgi:ankyrin repeat protein